MTPLVLAILFHDFYEKLAPEHGYETREDTREFNRDSPNGKLMIATCEKILSTFDVVGKEYHEKILDKAAHLDRLEAAGLYKWEGYVHLDIIHDEEE